MLERLKQSIVDCPVVGIGDYQYFVHPITDGIPMMDPALLREVTDRMIEIGDFECDRILAPEAMGIHLAVPIALSLGIPYSIVRKRGYGLPGELNISQYTGYSHTDMYVNGVKGGDRVVIVDDVLSTGGTLKALVGALREIGAEIVDIIMVFEKTQHKSELENEIGIKVKTLLKVDVVNGHTVYYE
ncbi:MAG: adenine phosphoribosyltransferase [Candidatus Methanomethylophilaceae archaeon]|nr:adenine phosphoribosyltransferase [Candidatus Methanomethylophilaceae archaeon]MDI3541690.1 adenine phosphoribosyltransferase [Candidatus Methanomethylophilaceae archaeon]HIJ00382.1 purine phosphoribosyltransferase family protein [Candidatus Methanomethylophilaceae archaeon]